jgi:protein tyrosine/serine phosphatase
MGGRHLDWDGCFNVRDLGGLPAVDGRRTRPGAIVRADSLNRLTAAGWAALRAHGVRTVLDLRDPPERGPDAAPRPGDLTTVEIPLEDLSDTAFWQEWRRYCLTPLYYRAFLARYPQRIGEVVAAIAAAEPGGVVFHCGHGRDRTGLIALVLLALAGVTPEAIAADHALSPDRLRPYLERVGKAHEEHHALAQLHAAGTTAEAVVAAAVSSLDARAYLLAAGLTPARVAALEARLLA